MEERFGTGRWARLFVLVAWLAGGARAASAVNLDEIAVRAQNLAAEAFQDNAWAVPQWLGKITYEQWRDIRFRPEVALWRDDRSPFQVQFFHPGLYYSRVVGVNVVDAGGARPLGFSPGLFSYGHNDFASKIPQTLGFAGLRVHAPIKKPDYFDEVLVFLGASYFRAIGQGQVFGLSARALAIDTALPSGEEFPFFREFWIARPVEWETDLVVYALLDSPSLTGAYRFVLHPGVRTSVDVEGRLFLRREVGKLGLAPLTSMFFHGENSTNVFEDFRPEVHDSDGLSLHLNSSEWLWRPIQNPRQLSVATFEMPSPRGFGLLQRDRDFDHYQDLGTNAQLRPSAWVTPRGDWGRGRLELVEIPTKSDSNDNIVTFWVPEKGPKPGEAYEIAYGITWSGEDSPFDVGRVAATRRARGSAEGAQRLVIDFVGDELAALPADSVLRGVVSVASGEDSAELLDQQVLANPATRGWRLIFQVRPLSGTPVELRAYLDKGGTPLTETWSYVLMP